MVVSSTYALSVDLESARTITAERIEFDRRSQAIRTVGQAEMETADGQRMTWSDAHMEQRGALAGGDNVQVWLGRRTFF
ncbi:MAG: hypothetical protein FWE17_02250, partial [Alphaproteobacteria bacterium]|nr:hypothetical protein [Alphaproteobacteria bacterium]